MVAKNRFDLSHKESPKGSQKIGCSRHVAPLYRLAMYICSRDPENVVAKDRLPHNRGEHIGISSKVLY